MTGAEGREKRNWQRLIATVALAVAGLAFVASEASGAWVLGNAKIAGSKSARKILVPMNLPLEVSGSKVKGQITVNLPGRKWTRNWDAKVHSGALRLADSRNYFRYVHGEKIPEGLAKAILRAGTRARINSKIEYPLPSVDPLEERAAGHGVEQKGLKRAGTGFCETLPRVEIQVPKNGYRQFSAPTCGRRIAWQIGEPPPPGGNFKIQGNNFRFWPNKGSSGAEQVLVNGYSKGQLVAAQRIHFRLGKVAPSEVSVVAMGDSVTAGFGYFGKTGKPMTIGQLFDCKPGATTLNDACSSNSSGRNSSVGTKPAYLPDFGLSRNISWAAQWANEYGITDFENYAVTGSAPADWLPGGQFNSTFQQIVSQNPDYILMTLGANPLLSDVLFNVDTMGCALESDLFGDFRQCVLDAFATVNLSQNMNQIFTDLTASSTSKIVVMEYPLTVPSSAIAYTATQIEMMGQLLNEVVADEANTVAADRIAVVAPPRFDVGIDMEPMYPSGFSCSFLGYKVDGPSVQSTPTQDELLLDHPLSFCSGPAIGTPWVISGDTGIHPSAAGYFQMASQIPAPGS